MKEEQILKRFKIPWASMMYEYNRNHETKYVAVKDWLEYLYKANNEVATSLSDKLLVSHASLCSILRWFGITKTTDFKASFLSISAEKMSTMTKLEIMKETGISENWFHEIIKRTRREYKKMNVECGTGDHNYRVWEHSKKGTEPETLTDWKTNGQCRNWIIKKFGVWPHYIHISKAKDAKNFSTYKRWGGA